MLLAIDTSAGTSVALVDRDARVLAHVDSADTRSHAELVGTFIADCLATARVRPQELSGVAIGMGPGPFTGLRVGIAAARVFAFAVGVPVLGIVSHDAIAFDRNDREHIDFDRNEPLLIVTDARRREVYWSTYSGLDSAGIPVRDVGPALARPDELADVVPDFANYRRLDAATVSAASLGLLAEALFANGRPCASAEPLYLRSPDVTMSTGPKRAS